MWESEACVEQWVWESEACVRPALRVRVRVRACTLLEFVERDSSCFRD